MKYSKTGLKAAGLIVLGCLLLKAPSLHRKYLRSYVAYRTVEIMNTGEPRAGGTGVHIKLPSGKNAILTNAHVCGLKDEKGMLKIFSPALDRPIERKVIEQADFTDLCLVEPIEGINGLSIGSEPAVGDIVSAIGHPMLQPITMTSGEVVSYQPITMLDHLIEFMGQPVGDPKCDLPKNKLLTIETPFGRIQACLVTLRSMSTTITTTGGSSGSGVVDAYGRIVGLVFGGDEEVHWSDAVPVKEIRKFIAPY